MNNRNFKTPKVLFLLAFSLLFSSFNSFSQERKFPAKFHYTSKTGKLIVGDKATLTFLLSDIKSAADYETIYAALSKQDLIRKVVISAFNETDGTALCAITFSNQTSNPYKPNHLQKVFTSLNIPNLYFDNELIASKDIVSYMLTKEKQEHPEKK